MALTLPENPKVFMSTSAREKVAERNGPRRIVFGMQRKTKNSEAKVSVRR